MAAKESQVLDLLNKEYKLEVEAILLYTNLAYVVKSWGLEKLYDYYYKDAKEEGNHLEKVTNRLLEIEPTYQPVLEGKTGKSIPKDLKLSFIMLKALMEATRTNLKDTILVAEAVEDYVTRDVMYELLAPTEKTLVWIAAQEKLLEVIGLQNYAAIWV
jgi:bacterioferritin